MDTEITFDTEAQRAAYGKVAGFVRELYGESAYMATGQPRFLLRAGSAPVVLMVAPFGQGAVVHAYAGLATEVEPSAKLMEKLLMLNAKLFFGSFCFDGGVVSVQDSVLAESCTKADIRNLLQVVGELADHYDDELIAEFGGKKPLE